MKKLIFALLVLSQSISAFASELSNCTANKGAYISGTVISAPTYASSSTVIEGVRLTHTHVNLRADQDGKTYDVSMANVYAVDYVRNATVSPKTLAAIKVGNRLSVCGKKYTSGTGIHWVHSNCGVTPTLAKPNGSTKIFTSSTTVGLNLERSQSYCYLFN
ncbi:MAG: hypothetical protein V4631_19340 [Pseudomonadota bacterium]